MSNIENLSQFGDCFLRKEKKKFRTILYHQKLREKNLNRSYLLWNQRLKKIITFKINISIKVFI